MNYYEILHIEPTASLQDIKKAYRRLALLYHPDKNSNSKESTELFKQLSEAYQVLSDPVQRSYYDNTGIKNIDFDMMSSLELFTYFFKDYDPKLLNIIEKTYGRIQEKLQTNETDSLLNIIYNIEKKDIIKDASHLAINYVSEYIQQYMSSSKENKNIPKHPIYNIDTILPITTITLPIEYYRDNDHITIYIMSDGITHELSLQTIFTHHNISFQNKDLVMNIDIGLQDYIRGFQFSYNYIHTFIDVPILLSKYSSCIVKFEQYGLPRNKHQPQHTREYGDLIIQFTIISNIDRLYTPPLHTDFTYSILLKDIC